MARSSVNKPTIGDVAKLAGVVPSTVSHVLNGTATISADTKERVMRAVEELNYSPNALARALRQKKTKIIGVVIRDISSEFYAQCIASIMAEGRKDGYVVLICNALYDQNTLMDGVKALIERRADGLIFLGGGNDADIIKEVKAAHIPYILADRYEEGEVAVQYDNIETVRNLVHILYEAGYRKFFYIGEKLTIQKNLSDRYNGFMQGMLECKIPQQQYAAIIEEGMQESRFKYDGSYRIFDEYYEEIEPGRTVILTSNDMIAVGVASAAMRKGMSIPEDVSVVGFDDIQIARYFNPTLATVRQDEQLLGQRCYETIKKLIAGEKADVPELLPQKIVIRESVTMPEKLIEKYGLIDGRDAKGV